MDRLFDIAEVELELLAGERGGGGQQLKRPLRHLEAAAIVLQEIQAAAIDGGSPKMCFVVAARQGWVAGGGLWLRLGRAPVGWMVARGERTRPMMAAGWLRQGDEEGER